MDEILLTAGEVRLIADGKKVDAIKSVRNRTGADLVSSKNAYDNYATAIKKMPFPLCGYCQGSGRITTMCSACNGSGQHMR